MQREYTNTIGYLLFGFVKILFLRPLPFEITQQFTSIQNETCDEANCRRRVPVMPLRGQGELGVYRGGADALGLGEGRRLMAPPAAWLRTASPPRIDVYTVTYALHGLFMLFMQ